MSLDLHNTQLLKNFAVLEKIGEGAAGNVFLGVSEDNMKVVIKIIPLKNSWCQGEYKREVLSLKKLKNTPHIVQLIDSFVNGTNGVIVLQKMDTDLLDFIENRDISVEEAKTIFRQVCIAILQMHKRKIAHLDIKPENIFLNDDDINSVVVGDLGSSFRWSRRNNQKIGLAGTAFYCAPEVKQKQSYEPSAADIWSLGVLLHVLLTGFWPFSAASQDQLNRNVQEGKIHLLEKRLPKDDSLLNLLKRMLSYNSEDRPSIEDVFFSEFVGGKEIEHQLKSPSAEKKFKTSGDGIKSSYSQPNLADLNLIINATTNNDQIGELSESDPEIFVLSPRGMKKRTTKGKHAKRNSWGTKFLFSRLSNLFPK